MNQADKNRSHSPSGYQFKLNPESKAAESLCYPLKAIWQFIRNLLEISHTLWSIYLLTTKCPSKSSTNARIKPMGPSRHHGPAIPKLSHQKNKEKSNLLLKEAALPLRAAKNSLFFLFTNLIYSSSCLATFLQKYLYFTTHFLLYSFTLMCL